MFLVGVSKKKLINFSINLLFLNKKNKQILKMFRSSDSSNSSNSCPSGTGMDRNGNCRDFQSNDSGVGPGANRGW
jgi:hypothetical protein